MAARDGPTTRLARRPTTDAEATGLESRRASSARFDGVKSSEEDDPPTRSRTARWRAHSRMAVAPIAVAPMVVASALGAAAAAARVGWKSRPASIKDGVATMLPKAAKAATAPSRPP